MKRSKKRDCLVIYSHLLILFWFFMFVKILNVLIYTRKCWNFSKFCRQVYKSYNDKCFIVF